MITAVIIGSGNVAQHLISALQQCSGVKIAQAFARHPEALEMFSGSLRVTSVLSDLAAADVYIIAVSDAAIAAVSDQLPFTGKLVVHTSGSVAMDASSGKNRRGVFYPLQTFSKNKALDFTDIPICIEAENPEDLRLLEHLGRGLSHAVYEIDSDQRAALHVAAVFASNFTNHMYRISEKICNENGMPFDVLKPLIAETANKLNTLRPSEAQTGPAIRNDQPTIARHLRQLTDENQRNIYQILTQSIRHEQEL